MAIVIFFTLWDYIPTILILTTITDKAIGNQEKSLYRSMKVGSRSKRSKSRSKALLSSANDLEANAITPLSSTKSKKSIGSKGHTAHSSGESSGNQSNSEEYDSSSSRNSERNGSFSKWKNWLFNETTRDIQSKYKKSNGVAGNNLGKGANEKGSKLVVIPEEKPLLREDASAASAKSRPSGYGSTTRSSKGTGAVHGNVRSPTIDIVKRKVENESSGEEEEEDDVLDRRSLDR